MDQERHRGDVSASKSTRGVTRRDALRVAAVAGAATAAVWSAPAIVSVNAASAETNPLEPTVPSDPNGTTQATDANNPPTQPTRPNVVAGAEESRTPDAAAANAVPGSPTFTG